MVRKQVSEHYKWHPGKLWIVVLVSGQLFISLIAAAKPAQAENFVSGAFQQQWNTTDADVATGKVSRTYFWGPQPFAHTQEVYAEAPTTTREVQYFDKGRMELTKRTGQNPDTVTNGLLTVELVSGNMQLGDNTFVTHSPATNPVAGDPTNNPESPTYASFNTGKLAFGVPGAISATNRVGQTIDQKIDKDGNVSTLTNALYPVKYATYMEQTGHNISDVFYNFFQAAPLGPDKWLAVMGFPLTEPYWISATVAGKTQNVLVQLFERRALTYTPLNSAGFQVEMANIGQHYYAWRYGVDLHHDVLPGNYRLLWTQANSLYSSSLQQVESHKLIDGGNDPIQSVYPNKHGLIAVGINGTLNLLDLSSPDPANALPYDAALKSYDSRSIVGAVWSADGKRLVVCYSGFNSHPVPVGYSNSITVLEVYDLDGVKLVNTATVYNQPASTGISNLTLSSGGRYLAFVSSYFISDNKTGYALKTLDLANSIEQSPVLDQQPEDIEISDLSWIGSSDRLLVSYKHSLKNYGRIATFDPGGNRVTILSDVPAFSQASLSPDGNYLALLNASNPNAITVSFRTLANPGVELASSGPFPIDPDNKPADKDDMLSSDLAEWSADSSYISMSSRRYNMTRWNVSSFKLISPVGGKIIYSSEISWYEAGNLYHNENYLLGGPHWVIHNSNFVAYRPEYFQNISVQNTDGSDNVNIYTTNDGAKFVTPLLVVQG